MSKPIFNVLRLTLSLTITAKRSGNSKAIYGKINTLPVFSHLSHFVFQILELDSKSSYLQIDWISRILYWIQSTSDQSSLVQYDLNSGVFTTVLDKEAHMSCLNVDPYHK